MTADCGMVAPKPLSVAAAAVLISMLDVVYVIFFLGDCRQQHGRSEALECGGSSGAHLHARLHHREAAATSLHADPHAYRSGDIPAHSLLYTWMCAPWVTRLTTEKQWRQAPMWVHVYIDGVILLSSVPSP